jgi:hypothetical protein
MNDADIGDTLIDCGYHSYHSPSYGTAAAA